MKGLISFQEMKERYERGEDPFALTLEKWVRIKNYLNVTEEIGYPELIKLLEAVMMKIPFCFEYESNCNLCPLERLCQKFPSTYHQILGLFHYLLATNAPLPKPYLIQLIDKLMVEIEEAKKLWKKMLL
ncbi:MAG: hypothetical protein LWW95_04655 [Candidatus Desulfofervidus auxilii]|nr:hypothetical protein [Candidatus Desulfofervidus auxilii]